MVGYAVAAWIMLCVIFALWGWAIFGPAKADRAMAKYEAERAAFERMFE